MNRKGILKTILLTFVFNLGKYGDSFGNSYIQIKKYTVKMLILNPLPPSVFFVNFGKCLAIMDDP